MNKKIYLGVSFVLVTLLTATVVSQVHAVEPGVNFVPVSSCIQVGKDIKIRRTSGDSESTLTSACRDAGHGKRQYTLVCTSNKEYKVSWTECPVAPVPDTQSPTLSFSASALKETLTNNTYSYQVRVTASDDKSNIKGIFVTVKNPSNENFESFWIDGKNATATTESGFGQKSVYREVTRPGLQTGKEYLVSVTAYDMAGNARKSSTIKVYLAKQDTVSPTIDANVSFASTWDVGYKTKRFAPTVFANASDNVKVTKIVLYHNTSYLWEGYTAVKTCENSSGVKSCSHTFGPLTRGNFYAQAWDAAGNSVSSVRFAF